MSRYISCQHLLSPVVPSTAARMQPLAAIARFSCRDARFVSQLGTIRGAAAGTLRYICLFSTVFLPHKHLLTRDATGRDGTRTAPA